MAAATATEPADQMARVVHGAIKEKPCEIAEQDDEGDP
jgi:hypothetical protein